MKEFDIKGLQLAKIQAEIFERSIDVFSCSSHIFLRRFINSNLLTRLDKNNIVAIDFTIDEALISINDQFGDSEYGEVKYTKDELYWMGYFYKYISYTREISTKFLFKIFDYRKLKEMYFVSHTQDFEYVISSLLEILGLSEDIFDPNSRLKDTINRHWDVKDY